MTETTASALRPPPILALAAVTGLAPFALNIIVPSVPGLAGAFAVDYATANLTVTAFIVAMAIGQLVIGPLSDALGRRPTLIGGVVVFVAGSVLCALSGSIEGLILGRFIEAAGGVAGVVLGRAITRDTHGRDRSASAIGYLTMVMVVAPMVAPVIGGVIHEQIGWRAIFWVLTGLGLAGVLVIRSYIAETNVAGRQPPRLGALVGNFAALLGLRAFVGFTLTMSFGSALFFTFLAAAPYVTIEILGYTATEYGIGFMSISVGYMLGNLTAAQLVPRFGTERMILAGCIIGIVGTCVMAGVVFAGGLTIVTLFLTMTLITYSNGLVMPTGIASAISVRPDLAGSAAGLSGFIQFSFGAAATYVVALAQDGTAAPLIWQLAAIALLSLASYAIAVTAPERAK